MAVIPATALNSQVNNIDRVVSVLDMDPTYRGMSAVEQSGTVPVFMKGNEINKNKCLKRDSRNRQLLLEQKQSTSETAVTCYQQL